MRPLPLLLLLSLAACSGDPRAYGLTGSRSVAAPPVSNPAISPLDAPESGTVYGPTSGPNTGGGRFWGYN